MVFAVADSSTPSRNAKEIVVNLGTISAATAVIYAFCLICMPQRLPNCIGTNRAGFGFRATSIHIVVIDRFSIGFTTVRTSSRCETGCIRPAMSIGFASFLTAQHTSFRMRACSCSKAVLQGCSLGLSTARACLGHKASCFNPIMTQRLTLCRITTKTALRIFAGSFCPNVV